MKSMTCQQLGGPCQLSLHGETADEIIKHRTVICVRQPAAATQTTFPRTRR